MEMCEIMAKFYCPECNGDMDEVEWGQFKMCFKCYEKKNTIPVNTKNLFNTREKCNWNGFNDRLFWDLG